MASLWTGLYPVRSRVLRAYDAVSPDAQMPAEVFQEAGFRTSGEMEDLLAAAVGEALHDTVAFYDGEVRTAGVLEIRRDTLTVVDTVVVDTPGLMRVLRWDPVDQAGLHIE